MEEAGIVVVGAGIAGAATAWSLARRGAKGVLLLEREDAPDRHSSGRNAAILRTAIPDPATHALARDSMAFYSSPPEGFASQPLYTPTGLYLAATPDAPDDLSWTRDPRLARGAREVPVAELRARVPLLGGDLSRVISVPGEGVLDVSAIHQGLLAGAARAGAELRFRCPVEGLLRSGDRIVGVRSGTTEILARVVVIASGAWARGLARGVGLDLPLIPYRRHLMVTESLSEVDPSWPVVWISGGDFYFRPESGGLLMSACDQQAVEPEEGELTQESALLGIAERASHWLPSLGDAGAAHAWSGMRTFAPDQRFVIGPDPRVSGLHWLAALGGHGITCGAAAGEVAADWILEGRSEHRAAEALLPQRLLAKPALPGGVA